MRSSHNWVDPQLPQDDALPTPSVYRAIQFLEALRDIDEGMQIKDALVLLRVASKPSMYQRELSKYVPLTQSTAARIVDRLGDRSGLGLINSREDFEDRRTNILTLTPRGQEAVKALLARL
ncbi:MarR family winged helix-turn-helix transcriptional regulator [Bosea beijingensis]